MIERIEIESFAVAQSMVVELHPRLNVFTGETGAGKSIIAGALDFALGARKGREVIAAGSDRASVRVALGDGRTISRTVGVGGRTSARLDDSPLGLQDLRDLTSKLADIHGQSGQLSLLNTRTQLEILDEFAGITGRRDKFAVDVRRLRSVRRELAQLEEDGRQRERLVDQLTFEIEEIAAATLQEGEDDALRAEAQRLGNASSLIEETERALLALDEPAVSDVLAAVQAIVAGDTAATALVDLGASLEATMADLSRELRTYRETLELDPARLDETQARLDLIARLRRKYGETVRDVLAYEQEARKRLANQTGAEAVEAELKSEESTLVTSLAAHADAISNARREAASKLTVAAMQELAQLGMPKASFAIGFGCEDDSHGLCVAQPDYEAIKAGQERTDSEPLPRAFTETGVDAIEFLVSFNVGADERPLAQVASGGETSRFMLALTTVLGATVPARTIVLDEVDEGVGGRAGTIVGQALRRLALRHQVICITHLPQVAVFSDAHFAVTKTTDGNVTWSEVHPVSGEARTTELALMLGGDSEANRAAAAELLDSAATPAG